MTATSIRWSLTLTLAALLAAGPSLGAQTLAKDRHGDPLPEGAVARFGTVRLRAGCDMVAFAPDAKTLIGLERRSLRVWDAANGQLLQDRTLPGGPKEPEGDLETGLSPDARTLVLAETGAVEMWDLPSAKRLDLSLPKGRKRIDAVAASDDRRLLAFVETVGTREPRFKGGFGLDEPVQQLWLWDTKAGRAVQLGQDDSSLVALAVSPDGRFVAASSSLEGTRVWDAATQKQLWKTPTKKLQFGGEQVYNAGKLAFTPDERHLIASPGGGQHDWFVWDAETGRPVEMFRPPTIGYAWTFAVSPDGLSLLIPTATYYVLWDLQEGKIRHEWPGALQAGKGVFAPDGRSVVTYDTILRRWDVKTGKLLYEDVSPLGHTSPVRQLFFSPDGRRLTSIADDGVARIWDVPTARPLRTIDLAGVQTKVWTKSPDGNTLIAAEEKLTVHRWPLDKEGPRESVELREAQELNIRLAPQHVRVTPDGQTLVVSAWPSSPEYQYRKYSFSFWDLATGKLRHWGGDPGNDFHGDDSWLSPDGAVSAGYGGVFDVRTGERRLHLLVEGPADAAGVHVFSPDGRLVAALAKDARVWEVATGKPLIDLPDEGTYRAAFSPDGRYYASADPGQLRVWDLATGKVVLERPAPPHLDGGSGHWACSGVVVAPDGRSFATGHPDGTILLWAMPPRAASATGLTDREADALWADLDAEPGRAYAAVWRLREFPAEAVKLLSRRYPPPPSGRRRGGGPDPQTGQRAVQGSRGGVAPVEGAGPRRGGGVASVPQGGFTRGTEAARRSPVGAACPRATTAGRGPAGRARRGGHGGVRHSRNSAAPGGVGEGERERVAHRRGVAGSGAPPGEPGALAAGERSPAANAPGSPGRVVTNLYKFPVFLRLECTALGNR